MKACAIIAEYNPFHNGHAFHAVQAREKSGADVVIAIMSGNFTQRGEPAIVDKWVRTQVALVKGIDIVIELPTYAVIESADYFGYEAIRLAHYVQASTLAFGIENGEIQDFQRLADILNNRHPNKDYHQTNQQRVLTLLKKDAPLLLTPNNQLAFSYIKAIKKQQATLSCVPIQRVGAEHTDKQLVSGQVYASGTAIRQRWLEQGVCLDGVPLEWKDIFEQGASLANGNDFWQLIKATILLESLETLATFQHVEEGMEHRLKKYVKQATSYQDFLNKVKTKRFNQARLQRMCLAIVLRLTKKSVEKAYQEPIHSVRVLGATPKGMVYLKQLQAVNYITQLKKQDVTTFNEQLRIDDVYQFLTNGQEQNFRQMIRVSK